MTKEDYKELKKALWEIEMKKQGKDIPYLEYQDIMNIVLEQRKTGGKINLEQESYDFYHKDFMKVLAYLEEQERENAKQEATDYFAQVEKDKEKAVQKILEQNRNIPWQVRKNEPEIRQAVKMAVGNPSIGDLSYRKTLAQLMGGELQEDGRVEIDERRLNERMIQEDFNKKQEK
jgi:hypothetical protein